MGFLQAPWRLSALVNPELDDEDRYLWLLQYVRTYLERDVRDLAALRDLEPFVRLQRYVAFQTGAILNYSGLTTNRHIDQDCPALYSLSRNELSDADFACLGAKQKQAAC